MVYRYVDPLVLHLKSMIQYRKFRAGDKTYIDNLLKVEKSENPSRILYCFGIAHEYPGSFILTYIRSSNPHHEYVGLYPKGFKFRKREFTDIDHLVAYFQRHINDSPQPDISSVAAVVPIRSPATGGSSDSRWKSQMDSDGGRSSVPRNGMLLFIYLYSCHTITQNGMSIKLLFQVITISCLYYVQHLCIHIRKVFHVST